VFVVYSVDIEAEIFYTPQVLLVCYALTLTFMGCILVVVFFAGAKVLLKEVASRDPSYSEIYERIDGIEKIYLIGLITVDCVSIAITVSFDSLTYLVPAMINGILLLLASTSGAFFMLHKVNLTVRFQHNLATSQSDLDFNAVRFKVLRKKLFICSSLMLLMTCFVSYFSIHEIIGSWGQSVGLVNSGSFPEIMMFGNQSAITLILIINLSVIRNERRRISKNLNQIKSSGPKKSIEFSPNISGDNNSTVTTTQDQNPETL
jgi:hypothetical protein